MSQIVCPNCQSPQPATAAFCDNCGHSLANPGTASRSAPRPTPFLLEIDPANPPPGVQVCAICGALNFAEARFCDQCGSHLGEGTEPRGATINFADKTPRAGVPVAPSDPTLPEGRRPRLEVVRRLVLEPTGARLVFPPARMEIYVGREDPVSDIFPEIDLTPHGGEQAGVSRRHARFSLDAGVLVLEDLDSTNFTFVNRKRVLPGTRQVVRNGDELRFGRITARYEEI